MNIKHIMSGTILALVLTAGMSQAEPGRTITVNLHIAGAFSNNSLIDVNDDGHPATSFVGVGTTHLFNPFLSDHFLLQEEAETVNHHTSCRLPDGSSGEEHDLVQAHGILTRERDGSQLFLEATSEILCLNIPAHEAAVDLQGTFAGGTGVFAGAHGTWEEKGSGQGAVLVIDPHRHFFGHSDFDLTGTLKLPPR